MTRFGLLLTLVLIPAPQEKPTAVDAWGDPLPEGAVARLGSSRFQQGDRIYDLAYSAGGRIIVTSSWGSIRIWDAATGRLIRRIRAGQGSIETTAVTPDARTICATGCNTLQIGVWDSDSGALRFSLEGYGESPSFTGGGQASLAISGDGRRLASAIRDSVLRVWDLDRGKEIFKRTQLGGEKVAYSAGVGLSPDGRSVAASAGTNTYVLSVETGRVLLKIEQAGQLAVFSTDGRRVACAVKGRGGIAIWDIEGARELRFIEARTAHGRTFAWSPDEKYLAWAEYPGGLRIAEVSTGRVLHKYDGLVATAFAFSPDSRTLAVGFQHIIQLFDPVSGRELSEPQRHASSPGHFPWVYSSDGEMIAAGGLFAPIFFWDPLTGREIFRVDTPGKKLALSFTPDGRGIHVLEVQWAASATLRTIDLVSGRESRSFELDPKLVGTTNKFSPDGRFLGLGAHQGLRILETESGREIRQIATQGYSYGFTFSPDGAKLATGIGQKFTMMDTDSWTELWSEETRTGYYSQSVFSGDGREVAIDAGNRVRFLDALTGKPVRDISTARRDNDYTPIAALSPDGKSFALHAWDLRKVLWGEIHNPGSPRELILEETPWLSQFAPDGGSFAVATMDASILVWPLKPRAPAGKETLSDSWENLGSASIGKSRKAALRMSGGGAEAVGWIADKLKDRLNGPRDPDPKWKKLVAELDAEDIKTREEALNGLRKAGEPAEPALMQGLNSPPSEAAAASIRSLLDEIGRRPTPPGDATRRLLAVHVLELVGSREARSVLEEIADRMPAYAERRAAEAALLRLGASKRE